MKKIILAGAVLALAACSTAAQAPRITICLFCPGYPAEPEEMP